MSPLSLSLCLGNNLGDYDPLSSFSVEDFLTVWLHAHLSLTNVTSCKNFSYRSSHGYGFKELVSVLFIYYYYFWWFHIIPFYKRC